MDTDWSGWFEDLKITHNDRGETILSGQIRDQAALYGLLAKVRNLGLFIISVKYKADEPDDNSSVQEKITTTKIQLWCVHTTTLVTLHSHRHAALGCMHAENVRTALSSLTKVLTLKGTKIT